MTRKTVCALALIWTVMLPAAAGAQNTTIAICFPGTPTIVGAVTLEQYAGCIGASSASLEFSIPSSAVTGAGAGASRPTFGPFMFTKLLDSASPALFLAGVTGTRIAAAEVHFLQPANEQPSEVARISLSDVSVTAVKQVAADGEPALEEVSLTYSRVCVTSGASTNCFDIPSASVVPPAR